MPNLLMKNFENRLASGKVRAKNIVASFSWTWCRHWAIVWHRLFDRKFTIRHVTDTHTQSNGHITTAYASIELHNNYTRGPSSG